MTPWCAGQAGREAVGVGSAVDERAGAGGETAGAVPVSEVEVGSADCGELVSGAAPGRELGCRAVEAAEGAAEDEADGDVAGEAVGADGADGADGTGGAGGAEEIGAAGGTGAGSAGRSRTNAVIDTAAAARPAVSGSHQRAGSGRRGAGSGRRSWRVTVAAWADRAPRRRRSRSVSVISPPAGRGAASGRGARST
ncbi:hypothetical protein GCM10010172_82430 [Paractinoplanes ferrugineus]|uniref:Uncharacterized protein n=1 Tax=Paractinoplanes ferrugineus TaxID=113564 RepID=A0A919MDG7_9ACTN|nr:hypothetical protein Afe05nite_24040 [Actinoplanes ferrugineus]